MWKKVVSHILKLMDKSRGMFLENQYKNKHQEEAGSHIAWLGVKQEIVLPLDYIICHF